MKNDCKILESRTSQYQEIIHLCKQGISLGIGFTELSAFHAAIFKKIELENLPYGQALYSLMDDIDALEKLIDAKKQLNDTIMKIQMMSLVLARQKHAVSALLKSQSYGVTEKEILNVYEILDSARLGNSVRMSSSIDSSLLYFDNRNNRSISAPQNDVQNSDLIM